MPHFAAALPSAMAHTLSVECTSLWIWINPFLTYHFVSNWILSVMRHQEPELHLVLKTVTRVLAGFEPQQMVGWHHWLDGHEFKQVPGVGNGQGSLQCCNPCGCKESDTTERLNWTELNMGSSPSLKLMVSAGYKSLSMSSFFIGNRLQPLWILWIPKGRLE